MSEPVAGSAFGPPALADASEAGVFFVTGEDLTTLAAAAGEAGLLARHVDLQGCDGKATLLRRIAAALEFPAGFGHNWDALNDCLRDLDWLPASGYALLFANAGDLRAADEKEFEILLDVLDETAIDWAEHDKPFWAFLALPESVFAELDAAS